MTWASGGIGDATQRGSKQDGLARLDSDVKLKRVLLHHLLNFITIFVSCDLLFGVLSLLFCLVYVCTADNEAYVISHLL